MLRLPVRVLIGRGVSAWRDVGQPVHASELLSLRLGRNIPRATEEEARVGQGRRRGGVDAARGVAAMTRRHLGSTDAAVILGRSPFRAPHDLWRALRGAPERDAAPAMLRGLACEPHLAARVSRLVGAQLEPPPRPPPSSRGARDGEMLGPPVSAWGRRARLRRATPELLAKAAESVCCWRVRGAAGRVWFWGTDSLAGQGPCDTRDGAMKAALRAAGVR